MNTHRWMTTMVLMGMVSPLIAQQPNAYKPPATDQGRQPSYQQPAISPSNFDQGRQPVLQGAGTGGSLNVQSFPTQSAAGPVQVQPYSPSYPVLSPYLNLIRGGNTPGSLAVNYFNFVQPAQQATGSYMGRTPGQYSYERFGQPPGRVDPDQDYAPTMRPAGTPSAFQNTGGYFNRMGTIGLGARQPGRPATSQGRR